MSRQKRAARQSFLQGALLLTAGVLSVKIIGAVFKIPLTAVISEDGMGYFSTAYSFYNVIFSLATAGFPVAVSRMVSGFEAKGRLNDAFAVKSAAGRVFALTGVSGMLLMALTAPLYTRAVGSPGALPAMLALSPCILFCSLMAVFRGYYEGLSDMRPTAVSQVIEAAVKLVFGLSGAYFAIRHFTAELEASGTVLGRTVENEGAGRLMVSSLGAAAAVLGVTLGGLLGLLYLRRYDKTQGRSGRDISVGKLRRRELTRRLIRDSLPIAVGAVAMSFSGLIDASFLQTRIAGVLREDPAPLLAMYAGRIPEENLANLSSVPNYLFGCYNMALTLFMLVPSLTQAIGTSALPSVTRAWVGGKKEELQNAVETVLRVTNLFALPAGIGLSALAGPVAALLYGDRPSTQIVAAALEIMGIAAIFAAITTPLGSMLQAVGHVELPVILVLSGLAVKIALNYILAGVPEINILGGGISSLACYVLVTAAELIALARVARIRFDFTGTFIKPLLAALGCGASARFARPFFAEFLGEDRLATAAAILLAAAVYAGLLLLLRTLREEDLMQIPGGKKIIKKFGKYLKNDRRWGRI